MSATRLAQGRQAPTVWGLSPIQLHDRYWAARGVQVVRLGEPSEIVSGAELFLLTDPRTLAIFRLNRAVEALSWIKPDVLFVRLHDERDRGYRERAITGPENRFVRFERIYGGTDSRLARVALTPDRRIALLWQKSPDVRSGWRVIRREISRAHRTVLSLSGQTYDRSIDAETMHFVRDLMQVWKYPDATVGRARESRADLWVDETSRVDGAATLIGPVWVGAGRSVSTPGPIVGPAVLWDDPAATPPVDTLLWHEIEPTPGMVRPVKPRQRTSLSLGAKRLFDIVFALCALVLTLPMYPFIMLAIWLEDGRPFFFSHRRETRGGREFGCIKFRSMCKDADRIKTQLMAKNKADGPQFFIKDDPRMTRVGRFLRDANLDELPQFWNVLKGDMSVVGPRPSPFKENQYCPAWREARLSVRPGVTGLWQVRRTRREGQDFQEWIKYDLEYIENASWGLDLKIIWETIRLVLRGVMRA